MEYIGDSYCDDENNNLECNYDSGACCGSNVNTQYCTECICYEDLNCAAPLALIGNGFCNDEANTAGCSYDGGDCCGNNVKKNFCKTCECLDPNFVESTGCEYPQWEGDGWCDDGNNNADCTFDGGDCCGDDVKKTFCTDCFCLQ